MRARTLPVVLGLTALVTAAAPPTLPDGYHFIPEQLEFEWQQPDGNTVVIDAPKGLIVVDTGRSPKHVGRILDYAKERGRPIAAIINTHWHLDHLTGNADIRAVYPAKVYASDGIEGALVGFLNGPRDRADKMLADPQTPQGAKDQILRGRSRLDHPDTLRPTDVVSASGQMTIAGRPLQVHLAKFAASEGDVWLYDPKTRIAVVGDLIVDLVPYMDTACADGWKKALEAIAAKPFVLVVPGHGQPMNRDHFNLWRRAFNNFVDCGASDTDASLCVEGWMNDAAAFIPKEMESDVREAAKYYLDSRLRTSPEKRQKYCKTLKAT